MVNPRLRKYIETYLNQGYSLRQIKSALLKQGYSNAEINSAIPKPPKRRFNPYLLLIILLIVGISSLFFLNNVEMALEEKDVNYYQNECRHLCTIYKLQVNNSHGEYRPIEIIKSFYCDQGFSIDVNGDGVISNSEKIYCWESPLDTPCNAIECN